MRCSCTKQRLFILTWVLVIGVYVWFWESRPLPKKHFLGLGAVLKNEADVLPEWLCHYRAEGVEHFYLIDDGSTDGTFAVLEPYIHAGLVTLFVNTTHFNQEGNYRKYLAGALKDCVWLAIADLDEFLFAHGDTTIAQYLRLLDSNVGAVLVPWKMFGSNNHTAQPTSVIHGFTRRANYDTAQHSIIPKSVVRTSAVWWLRVHMHYVSLAYDVIDSTGHRLPFYLMWVVFGRKPHRVEWLSEQYFAESTLHLNHYAIQSWEWFKRVKMSRGDVSNAGLNNVRTADYFHEYDHNQALDDELSRKRPTCPPKKP